MTLALAHLITLRLVSFVMAGQACELLWLFRSREFSEIWSYKNLRNDLESALPLPKGMTQLLFSEKGFQLTLFIQALLAMSTLALNPVNSLPSLFFAFAGLFLTHLSICIRFRGTFNGGSDAMLFVVLTGILLSLVNPNPRWRELGLIYISIHTLFSYFKAGLVKLREPEWRSGQALSIFLSRSLHQESQSLARYLFQKPALTFVLSWTVLVFELTAVSSALFKEIAWFYFGAAIAFHLTIYLTLGLNRFFWVWMCAWPSVLYSTALLSR